MSSKKTHTPLTSKGKGNATTSNNVVQILVDDGGIRKFFTQEHKATFDNIVSMSKVRARKTGNT